MSQQAEMFSFVLAVMAVIFVVAFWGPGTLIRDKMEPESGSGTKLKQET